MPARCAERVEFSGRYGCGAAIPVISVALCVALCAVVLVGLSDLFATASTEPFAILAALLPGLSPRPRNGSQEAREEAAVREEQIKKAERTPNDRLPDEGPPNDRLSKESGDAVSSPHICLRAILAALPDAALTLDPEGLVTECNESAARLFPRMGIGKSLTMFLRNPDFTAALEAAWHAPRPITVHISDRVPVARSLEATVSRLDSQSSAAQLLVTFRDLTEREKIEQMRADFVANASHELRTPLASLIGYIETLQGPARYDEKARERFLSVMQTQAQRMSRLVDDLLSLTRVEMRAHLPPAGKADLNEVAAYVVRSLEPLALQQSARLNLAKLDRAAYVRADREEIVQALQNLVHNALKYARDDGGVIIDIAVNRIASDGASGEAARIEISVTDNGRGIAAHHIPRLVERFYRVNVKSSRAKGGTGLGLAIVKHIMLRHSGDLTISSKVGAGSTFTLSFNELDAP